MNFIVNLIRKYPYAFFFVVGVLIITGIRPLMRKIPPPPPVIGAVHNFELVNQLEKKFGSKELEGSAYVANFIFTSCTTVCPVSSQKMAALQKRFKENNVSVNLVSFSVDPETDLPAVLLEYAKKYEAQENWYFLTGSVPSIERALNSFLMQLEPKQQDSHGIMDIAHSSKFALVDFKGGLRGLYSSDEKGQDELFHRTLNLVRYSQSEIN
jgi:protein SCO1